MASRVFANRSWIPPIKQATGIDWPHPYIIRLFPKIVKFRSIYIKFYLILMLIKQALLTLGYAQTEK